MDGLTRRDLLLGTATLCGAGSGCASQQTRDDIPDKFPTSEATKTPAKPRRPDDPIIRFGDDEEGMRFHEFPANDCVYCADDGHAEYVSLSARDSSVVLKLENASVERPIELTLYVDRARFYEGLETTGKVTVPTTGEGITTVSARLEPGKGGHEVTFELPDDIPLERGFYLSVDATDPKSRLRRWFVRLFRFLAVPEYSADTGSVERLFWFNEDDFETSDHLRSRWRTDSFGTKRPYEQVKEKSHTLFVNGQRFNHRLWGVSLRIPTKRYQQRRERYWKKRRSLAYIYSVVYNSSPPLDRLSKRIWKALSQIGITDMERRIMGAARLVQYLPYEVVARRTRLPQTTLRSGKGDCSDKTVLMANIIRNEPFGLNPAYVPCQYRGGNHIGIGIDVKELGYSLDEYPDEWTTVAPREEVSDEAPDTEYAFLELTGPRWIGMMSNHYSDAYFQETANMDVLPEYRNISTE